MASLLVILMTMLNMGSGGRLQRGKRGQQGGRERTKEGGGEDVKGDTENTPPYLVGSGLAEVALIMNRGNDTANREAL